MEKVKKYLKEIFIDGLSGMALGLFATLIVGTILSQIAAFFSGAPAFYIGAAASLAKALTGAGIGVGVASKYGRAPLVTVSCGVAGLVGNQAAILVSDRLGFGNAGVITMLVALYSLNFLNALTLCRRRVDR